MTEFHTVELLVGFLAVSIIGVLACIALSVITLLGFIALSAIETMTPRRTKMIRIERAASRQIARTANSERRKLVSGR